MRNAVDLVGFKVNFVTPDHLSSNVDVFSKIKIELNSHINMETISSGVFLLKDIDRVVDFTTNSIKLSDFRKVECSVSCTGKEIILKPVSDLTRDCRYVIYVPKNTIRDFKGRSLDSDFISFFDTGLLEKSSPSDVLYPANNSVIDTLDKIEIEDVGGSSYVVEISTNKDFNIGVFSEILYSTTYKEKVRIGDGSYYIRAKATNSEWGETNFFTIKSFVNAMITESDLETFSYEAYEDNTLQVTSNFPVEKVNISSKVNLFHMEFNRLLSDDDIDFSETGLFKKHVTDAEFEIGPVDGVFMTVQDTSNNSSFVTFIPNSL